MFRYAKRDPTTLLLFCDGSRKQSGTSPKQSGYGVVGYYLGKEVFSVQVGLGKRSTIYDAEMFALAHASMKASTFISDHPDIAHISFFSDNLSAIQSIFTPSVHPAQLCSLLFRKHIVSFLDSSPQTTVTVKWSPGHADILGNERADSLAKDATLLHSPIGPTFSYLRHRAKRQVKVTWKQQWHMHQGSGKFQEADVTPPSTSVSPIFRSTPREVFGRLTQCLTGHGYIGEYYMRVVPSESPWCLCTDEVADPTLQTRDHIIFHCPRYDHHRHILRAHLPDFDNPAFTFAHLCEKKRGLPALVKFLEKSGAFTKTGHPISFDLPTPRDHQPP